MSQNDCILKLAGAHVLITGGLGFIGSNLVHACVEAGAEVTVFDCLDPRSGGNMANLLGVRKKIRLALHDIQDFDRVSKHVVGKDIIFNCAASTSHPFSMREPWLDQDVNCTGTINLLEATRRFNPQARLVHVGTTTQLGPLKYTPADEHHPEFPTDIYSANKSVSEKYVLIYARCHGLNATVARLSNTYGPRAAIHSPDFTFNNYFVGLALQGKPITVFGDGSQQRNVIYVGDAVDGLLALGRHPAARGETFFLVGDEHFNVAEIARLTVELMGAGEVRHVEWPVGRKIADVGDAIISNAKIKQTIGWSPRHDLRTGLLKTRQFFCEHLTNYLR
jgi:UDP-glucose 4-epimerase